MRPSTIWNHLIKAVRLGLVPAREVVELGDADHDRILEALAGLAGRGERSLVEPFEALGGVFPYEALRCVLAEQERAELERIGRTARDGNTE